MPIGEGAFAPFLIVLGYVKTSPQRTAPQDWGGGVDYLTHGRRLRRRGHPRGGALSSRQRGRDTAGVFAASLY